MEFEKLLPHVYRLRFKKGYDTAMHFIRYQEYYESLKYCGQIFTLVDYMEWYASEYGNGIFTYPADWTGFNVPSRALIEVAESNIPDVNKYDIQMRALINTVKKEEKGHPFYFIGTTEDEEDDGVLNHEIGHALYATNEEYHSVMENLLDELPKETYTECWKILQQMHYHPSVCRDEIHAYASTGVCEELEEVLPDELQKPFIKAYKAQRKKVEKGNG